MRTAVCAVLLGLASRDVFAGDGLKRLTSERLAATADAVEKLKAERKELKRPGPYREYRANLHVHSAFSHDSRGKIDEIVAAAKKVGTSILMFNEHPAPHYDFFADGHRGLHDGVLLIPGAEMRGFLVFPTQSLQGLDGGSNQEFTDLVVGRDGRMFISHLEERMDWEPVGITGVEIYNTHADFKEEKELIAAMRDPLWLFRSAGLFRQYPQAAYSALMDYPADYLRRYDELCQKAPHTGVSANDAHQNVGIRLRMANGDKVVVEDALEEKLVELDAASNPVLKALALGKKPDDVLFEILVDPYEASLRHVGTHLLMTELTQEAVWDALRAGRAFVAFDWLADSTGFDVAAISSSQRFELGSQVALTEGLKLAGAAPLPGTWKLIRNGEKITETSGSSCEFPVTQQGVYRVEVWLKVADEFKPWILSNPVYVATDSP
ncbi:MAG: hypothetical protein U0872_13860 [Planctomycetaceae bacterium]